MGTPQKVRFKLAWQNYRVGDVIEPSGMLRSWLMGNGYVVPVEEPALSISVPSPAPATAPARKRQRVSQ